MSSENGWAEMENIEQESRPARKEYHITETGQEELRNWLVSPRHLEITATRQ
ncbi:MAG: helix-turn-helix transcriptional regulator [Anaerolineales bacterium]|nr:helix-turn-helix transcriptional regulator [Chloroflexota bacterium]MBL6983114.1 helix-turn-helix transcriptional regulator [Anaerolineales bacterium]